MSKYTTEVRFICEQLANINTDKKGIAKIDEIIKKSWDKIFTKNWDIFDEKYREILCTKILKTFYTREICAETVELWKLWLDATLCAIMPYYNKLYESDLIKFDIFDNINITKKYEKKLNENNKNNENSKGNIETNSNSNNNGKNINKYSDTPQGGLTDIENNKYLTNVRIVENEDNTGTDINTNNELNTDSENKKDSLEEYIATITGKDNMKNNSDLLMDFRNTFINIDMMVIKDLEPLFFNLW